VSFVLPMREGGFVVGLPGCVSRFRPGDGTFERLVTFESDCPHNRTNDACIDSAGRLWFGTMDDRKQFPSGRLYRWDGAELIEQDRGYVISNGPAFSPDERTLYHTDTRARTIYRFDVGDSGCITAKQPFIQIEEGAGWPDGTAVDAEGALWVALFGGSSVRRYAGNGMLIETIAVPCADATKVAFGGEDLKTIFVTTAKAESAMEETCSEGAAGALYACSVDVPGLPQHGFAG
jgi:sugar lactone lactonase YvrE